MNVLPKYKREQLIALLVEGNSLRGTARIADVSYNTVLKFVPQIGATCETYQDRVLRNLPCTKLQCDEIWSFCHTRRHNVSPERQGQLGYGDLWTFVAIDPETKLVPSWLVGKRTLQTARVFIDDLKSRLSHRVQLTTDGFKAYIQAVEGSFGSDIDYGMLVKIYEDDKTDPETAPLHIEPEIKAHRISGNPDPKHMNTSRVERQNVTMRQSMRRFVRRTNGHSKKAYNHACAVSLHFMHYNFCRIHSTLKITPAMAAGVTDHVWSLGELVDLMTPDTVTDKKPNQAA